MNRRIAKKIRKAEATGRGDRYTLAQKVDAFRVAVLRCWAPKSINVTINSTFTAISPPASVT